MRRLWRWQHIDHNEAGRCRHGNALGRLDRRSIWLRVGAYIGSTLGWESLFKEVSSAKDWVWLDAQRPVATPIWGAFEWQELRRFGAQ